MAHIEPRKGSAPLEALPPELRVEILCASTDLDTLQNFIHASPVYRATYQGASAIVLAHVLRRLDVGAACIDGLTALRSVSLKWCLSERRDEIAAFLSSYGRVRRTAYRTPLVHFSPDHPCPDITEARRLVRLQDSMVAIMDGYYSSAKETLSAGDRSPSDTRDLSTLERLRILRALYRKMILCNLFGELAFSRQPWATLAGFREIAKTIKATFILTFPPWELEEIASMCSYMDRALVSFVERAGHSRRIGMFDRNKVLCAGPVIFLKIMNTAPEELVQAIKSLPNFEASNPQNVFYVKLPATFSYPADIYNDIDEETLLTLPEVERPSRGWMALCEEQSLPPLGQATWTPGRKIFVITWRHAARPQDHFLIFWDTNRFVGSTLRPF